MHTVSKVAVAALSLVLALTLRPADLQAGTALRMTVPDLVDRAELVFEGRVLSAQARTDERGLVLTDYFVSVQETFWGTPFGTRTFTLPGGVLSNGSGMVLAGMPRIEVGEDAIFFLTEQSAAGNRMPVGLAQGKFRLVKDPLGETLLARDQEGLVLVDPRTGAVVPAAEQLLVGYDAVVDMIRAAAVAKQERR